MIWNIKKILLGTAISLMVLLICFGLGLLPLNLFFLKTTISAAMQDKTGVELIVEGPLWLQLGRKPKLTAHDVVVRWPDKPHHLSASISDLAIQTSATSLWRGDIDLQSLTARGIVIEPGPGEPSDWLPERLRLKAAAPLNGDMSLVLEGQVRGEAWKVSLGGASLDHLVSAKTEYPIATHLDLTGSSMEFNGSILLPWDTPGIAGQFAMQSEDLSSLLLELGQEIPGLGQLSLQSGIELDESMLELDGLEASLDDFSFTLSALARDWSTRPWFDITANVPLVDLARLPGMKQERADSDPTAPLDLQPLFDRLAGFDGKAVLTIDQVHHADFPVRDLAVSASLVKGLLTIDNAAASVSGIDMSAQASLNTSAACARLETSLWVPEMKLSTLSEFIRSDTNLEGVLENSQLTTVSCGASPRQHLQSLETQFGVAALALARPDDQAPLDFTNIHTSVNWRKAGRISFESELRGEPLTLSAEFGSVEQISSDEMWPIALQARSNTVELAFSGQTAINESGLILDLTLATQLGKSDISGEVRLSGTDRALPLKVDLHSKLLDLDELQMLLPDDEQNDPGSIRDWSKLLDETELLKRWHAVPSVDVKIAIDEIEGTSYEIGSMGLDARLEDRRLKDGHMQLNFEGVEMTGLVNVDMTELPTLFDYQVTLKNVDIGRLMKTLELSDTVNARVDQADIRFESKGNTVREVGQNMKIISTLRPLQWSFKAGPRNRQFDMNLSEVKVQAAPGMDTVWETRGTLNGFPLNAWLKTPNLRVMFDKNAPLPLRLTIGSRNDITMFDVVVYPETNEELRSRIQVSGRYSNEKEVDFSTLPSPLEDYSFSTELTYRENEYLASDIEVQVGSSNATGRFSVQPSGQGFVFDLEVGSSFLETDDFALWVQEFRTTKDFMDAPEDKDSEEAPLSMGLATMIDQYAKEFIGDNVWDINVNLSELRAGGSLLGETEFTLHMDDREILLDPATMRFPGGDVSIRYNGKEVGSNWGFDLNVYSKQLDFGGLLRLYNPNSTAEGKLYMNTSLHSRAESPEEVVNNLEGSINLAVFPQNVGAEFLDLWATNLIFALLPKGENQQQKSNCIVARFEVENGIMTSKETFLDSTDTIVRVRGEIDLVNRQLDLLAAPQAKMERFLSVTTPIVVTGPFDDFSVDLASGGFVKTMIRWFYGVIYVPWKWLTGERYPPDGIATCFKAMDWDVPTDTSLFYDLAD